MATTHQEHLMPAYLWLGTHEDLSVHVEAFLQSVLCTHNSCGVCNNCQAIRNHQHHAITWFYPEKTYTLEQLVPLTQTISFALEPGHHHFFVIQKADALSAACANSLLKSMEEPPAGYHFVLLAQQIHDILPTIRSRCIIKSFYAHNDLIRHKNLFDIFTLQRPLHPTTFLKELEQADINERDSLELLDNLLAYWAQCIKTTLDAEREHQRAQKMVHIIEKARLFPPMPGSSTLAWKNFFLQVTTIYNA
ncbi:MAG TPA: hypothetical protein VLG71_02225 [Candidatus Limnocylindria bacterium]|nr:hypothetical protein [Candidatus Limnocylindria bacterium]